MRDIGGEASHLFEGLLKSLRHAIEGVDQVVEFVIGPARLKLRGEIRPGQALSGSCDVIQRLQGSQLPQSPNLRSD